MHAADLIKQQIDKEEFVKSIKTKITKKKFYLKKRDYISLFVSGLILTSIPFITFFIDKARDDRSSASPINTDTSHTMPVLVLNYFPTSDGVNLNSSITGITSSLAGIRNWVNTIKTETLQGLEDGSRYQAYGDNTVLPSLDYSILAEYEYLETLPIGLQIGTNIYRPDYRTILNDHNICDLVDNQGLKEVWIFGWHHGNIEPVESNMSGPYGDISNSERTDDLPICSKTYVLYNYNYGRGPNEALHNHGHQIEVVLKHFGDPLFEERFIGPFSTYGSNDGSGNNFHRCGWTHTPPNTSGDYDYSNSRYSWTDCKDWKPDGSGTKVNINCSEWSCNQRLYHIWRWQSMPGRNNGIVGVTNWWDFIGDFDAAKASGQKLYYDLISPTVPTGLSQTSIFNTQITLSWDPSTDDYGINGYNIKRDGEVIGSTSSTSFTDFTVNPGTTYLYSVAAIDTSDNTSDYSGNLSVNSGSLPATSVTEPQLDSSSSKIGGELASYSWFHTVGNGQNRLLLVNVGIRRGGSTSVASVDFRGNDLERVGFQENGDLRTEIWKLTNPQPGLGRVTVNLSGNPNGSVSGATTWWGVDQSNPLGSYSSSSAFNNNPTVNVPSFVGDKIIDIVSLPNLSTDNNTVGSGQNSLLNLWSNGETRVLSSYRSASAGNTTMSWSTKWEAWSMSAIAIKFGQIDTQIPTVTFVGLNSGDSVSGTINISANASDDIGVSRVESIIDSNVISTDSTYPYNFSFPTTLILNGAHTAQFKAYDGFGRVGFSDIINFTVNNPVKIGDLNNDTQVNIFDASILFNNWGSTVQPNYDLNGNGIVDIFDGAILFDNWDL